jgi:hypothetical protein
MAPDDEVERTVTASPLPRETAVLVFTLQRTGSRPCPTCGGWKAESCRWRREGWS